MLPKKQKTRGGATLRLIVTALVAGAAAWLWFNQQYVIDQISVWQYKPTAAIREVAEKSSMSDTGTFLFYASHPVIDGTQNFNKVCNRLEEGTAVLGCYNGTQIYIYDVKDERLKGIHEVTAAHEMLHAAYQRLSEGERKRINELVEVEFKKLENNQDYKARMAFYARTEPGERDNELHSVIATEVSDISSELENHYKRYFADRQVVVKQYEKYQAVFQQIEAQTTALYQQLKQIGDEVNKRSKQFNQDVAALNSEIENFNTRARVGDFASQAQFASERAALVVQSNKLSSDKNAINALVDQYEAKRSEYNELANESQQLVDSINSNLAPTPSV